MVRRQRITQRRRRFAQSGLTLIELLVVMAILALAATIVLVNAPPQQSSARKAAGDFADALVAATDDAVVAGGVHRLEVKPEGWRIAALNERAWDDYRQGAADGDLRIAIDVEEAASANLSVLTGERGEKRDRDAPTIVRIDPFGDGAPFVMRFRDDREQWVVGHRDTGDIYVERE